MPSYKLLYFNFRGRAEIIRLMFAEAGQKYEDKRFEVKEWNDIKAETPLGQVPVLYIDDKPLAQSGTIVRYLARKFKLDGANDLEAAYADMIVTTINEVSDKFGDSWKKTIVLEKDEKRKEELMKEYFETHVCPIYAKFEKKFSDSKNQYLVGKQLTYADIAIANSMTGLNQFFPGFLDKYPNLKALVKRTEERPNIKEWISKRPVTSF